MNPTAIYCDDDCIGTLSDAIYFDDTWFANIVVVLTADGVRSQRLTDYIAFCIDWHDRIGTNPDASEFRAFDDVIRDSQWFAVDRNGHRSAIADAPVFVADSEVTWRLG